MREVFRKIYCCEVCGKEFGTSEECIKHEITHCENWGNGRLAKELRHVSDSATSWSSGDTILGYVCSDFKDLMCEAAKRLEERKIDKEKIMDEEEDN